MLPFASSFVRFGIASSALLLALSGTLQAQTPHDLLWEPGLSSHAGAENLGTVHRGLFALENRYLPPRWTNEETFLGKTFGLSYRLARFILIDSPLTYMATLTQHEVFGHGATIRYAGAHADSYVLRLPFPYGAGGGRTRLPSGKRFGFQEDLWLRANGMNANLVFAQSVRNRAVRDGRLRYGDALLGLAGHLDLPLYVWGTPEEGASPSNDVMNYVTGLQVYDERRSRRISDSPDRLDALKRRVRVSLVDPFTWMALWTILYDYGWRGSSSSGLWTVTVGPIRYLPSVHLVLSPFGSELLLEHLVVHRSRLWTVSMRGGEGPWGQFGGLGLEVDPLVAAGRLQIEGRVDLWYQPQVVFVENRRPSESLSRELGGRVEATAAVRPSPDWPVSGVATLGYKTAGFLLGEPLDNAVLVELGLRLHPNILK